jgi:3-oxoacyl-[acyl-carrier-protein] synthase II
LTATAVKPRARSRIVVTGVGVYCPIGTSPEELLASIKAGRGGIGPIRSFDTSSLDVHHGAEIVDHDPSTAFTPSDAAMLDRTAQCAILAARQAIARARLDVSGESADRIGVVMGICAGGRGDSNRTLQEPPPWADIAHARTFLGTSHFTQTGAVVAKLGLHGPQATISTACASSASALGHACELLEAGKADAILAGGADAFSFHTYAGFHALGAMAREPCSPFGNVVGVTFGEGAGCVVLERLDDALRRGPSIFGEILGFGASGDAHHITAPHPSGDGLRRAMERALSMAALRPADIDYVNAHGTGTRDNDGAETLAIKAVFKDARAIPPVSSSKSFFGHTLGAAGVLEFIVSLLCSAEGIIPPTINFACPRAGCDLDYVPNQARKGRIRRFLSNSAAFGGVNAVLAAGEYVPDRAAGPVAVDRVGITGMAVLSSVACSLDGFAAALREGRTGIDVIDRFETQDGRKRSAALIHDFQPRKLLPTLDVRRMDRLNQYASVAAGLALKDAGLQGSRTGGDRIGVIVALTRGPVSTQEQFIENLRSCGVAKLSPKFFPAMVASTVAGQISQAHRLRGFNSTVIDGTGAGLHALLHAFETLRQDDGLDAVLVVAADEVGALFHRIYDRLGLLVTEDEEPGRVRPYHPAGRGLVLGEGAVAVLLERLASARARGARLRAELTGYGLTSEAGGAKEVANGVQLERAMRLALAEAGVPPSKLDLIYGLGRGVREHDEREVRALTRLLESRPTPVGSALGNVGVAEASCGLFSVAAATLGIERGEAYPIAGADELMGELAYIRGDVRPGTYRRALVVGSTEAGNNAALVLASTDAGST